MNIFPLTVIDEQADFIVIDKPHNVNFHDEGHIGSGLFSQVKKQLAVDELYPVHRLDKMTSGLIVFAKNLAAAQIFQQQLAQHLIDKYYLAIAQGKPKKKQGLIKGDMEKSRRGMWKLTRAMDNPAATQFNSISIAPNTRLYLVRPLSGKTHQIRVALNSIGVPITGDPLYNNSSKADRGYLHAFGLSFHFKDKLYQYLCQPISGELFKVAQAQIENISPPWQQPWPQKK